MCWQDIQIAKAQSIGQAQRDQSGGLKAFAFPANMQRVRIIVSVELIADVVNPNSAAIELYAYASAIAAGTLVYAGTYLKEVVFDISRWGTIIQNQLVIQLVQLSGSNGLFVATEILLSDPLHQGKAVT